MTNFYINLRNDSSCLSMSNNCTPVKLKNKAADTYHKLCICNEHVSNNIILLPRLPNMLPGFLFKAGYRLVLLPTVHLVINYQFWFPYSEVCTVQTLSIQKHLLWLPGAFPQNIHQGSSVPMTPSFFRYLRLNRFYLLLKYLPKNPVLQ